MYYICIDIGGTSIKYGVLNEKGEIFLEGKIKTKITLNDNSILKDVKDVIRKIKKEYSKYEINGICVSSAGVVDSELGKIIFSGPTIPNYTNTEIKKEIEKEFGLQCEVENDVNCAGLGEYWLGAGKGKKSMVCVTIGTGIGGSIILDGKLLKGTGFTAGEIGYMNVNGNHIQEIASTTALVDLVHKRKKEKGISVKLNGLEIFGLAKKGDEICIEAIDTILENLSIGLVNIIYLLNPEIIVIGGGIAEQKEYLQKKIIEKVNKKLISDSFRKTKIEMAQKGNNAGLFGALYNFLNKINLSK